MTAGRPTDYTPELLENTEAYYLGNWSLNGEAIPSVAGLSLNLGISRDTVYEWMKDPEKKAFSDIVKQILAKQEMSLVTGGLNKKFDSSITKLLLTKHGYRDESAHEVTVPKPIDDLLKDDSVQTDKTTQEEN